MLFLGGVSERVDWHKAFWDHAKSFGHGGVNVFIEN